ncbi:MAG: Ldh family oxidoreductase [Lachnospiraceae bacterium]|nr:Ldh family oxidoreductase [Lachnospiraceae bacterium]
MGYQFWKTETLETFCLDVFEKFGFSGEDAAFITDVLLKSDLYGIESHGVQRLYRYYKGLLSGMIRKDAVPEILFETPVSAVIDGNDAMGQLVGRLAMNKAIEKAQTSGIGIVTVRNSNHYGIAGYYAKMACEKGFIGLSCTNTNPITVPTYGRTAMLGTNPIAIAVPADPFDFYFDAGTSVVTRGKLEVYNKEGKPLHEGWALDGDGIPTVDASVVLGNIAHHGGGGIMPLGGASEETGGHKGYGYAMLCELFSSIFSLGTPSSRTGRDGRALICHGFAAIDPAIFGDAVAIREHLSDYLEDIRRSPKAAGAERIYTHGEKEYEAEKRILREGIPVNDNTMAEFKEVCDGLSLDFGRYFSGYELRDTGFGGNFY